MLIKYRSLYHLFIVKGAVDSIKSTSTRCELETFEKYPFIKLIRYDVVLPLRRLTFRHRVYRYFSSVVHTYVYTHIQRHVFSIQHNTVSARIRAHLAVNLVARCIDFASYTK